jgi:hypothetical protein
MQQIPLPKLYWETFQDALQSQVKRLAKEIAGTLNQSEQPLLKALATEKITAYLFEEEGAELIDLQRMRCKHIQASTENPAVFQRCNHPILLGTSQAACPHHALHPKPSLQHPVETFRIIKDRGSGKKFWVDSEGHIRDSTLRICGTYTAEKSICTALKIET